MQKGFRLERINQKITVIGGAGFVGTNLCMRLSKNKIPFEILDLRMSRQFRKQTRIVDVRDVFSLKVDKITGDLVVNLAAVHRDDVKDKNEYFDTNVKGAENIISECKNIGVKIIFTSSVAVYGFADNETGENGPIRPINEYGKTKYIAEEKFRLWHSEDSEQNSFNHKTNSDFW